MFGIQRLIYPLPTKESSKGGKQSKSFVGKVEVLYKETPTVSESNDLLAVL